MRRSVAPLAVSAIVLAACSSGDDTTVDTPPSVTTETTETTKTTETTATSAAEQRFPDVLAVEATPADDGTWNFAVTILSPYDTPDRYADGWRVLGPDGEVYGEHMLMHDHAGEQPFTRTQWGVTIPADVDEVTIEGRDQEYGYGGATVTITLDG